MTTISEVIPEVPISGLDKADVLLELYNNAVEGTIEILHPVSCKAYREKARALIKNQTHLYFETVDLGSGPRALKVDLEGSAFNPERFDEAYGKGIALKAIERLKIRANFQLLSTYSRRKQYCDLLDPAIKRTKFSNTRATKPKTIKL